MLNLVPSDAFTIRSVKNTSVQALSAELFVCQVQITSWSLAITARLLGTQELTSPIQEIDRHIMYFKITLD